MPTFVYMTRCDGCGHCVDICPSDIMHIDTTYRRAFNIEPNMCWECYACVKACPQFAIDCRGYADFAPLGHSVRVRREEDKATISWKIQFRDGCEKNFVSPIRTTPWGSQGCELSCSDSARIKVQPNNNRNAITKRSVLSSTCRTETHPGIRCSAPKHVGRKEPPCNYLQSFEENR
jgi:adenylylsulfate reductase subunit B